MSGTKVHSNYEDLLTFTRASKGHALRPVSYGDELVANGTFDDNIDNWTDNNTEGTIAYNSSGAMDLARNGGNGANIAVQTISTLSVGKLYKVAFDVTAVNGAVRIRFDDQSFTTSPNNTTGHFSFSFVATTFSDDFIIDLRNAGNATATIDNVSVKEVLFDQPDGTLTLFEHPNNVPRVEYDADGNRLGLLVEESRTNLFRESEKLSEKDHDMSTSDNAAIAPDRNQTASFCKPTTFSTEHYIDDAGVTAGTDYAVSCFAKQGPGDYLLAFRGSGIGSNPPRFNLATGTIDNEGASSAWSNTKIEDVGNGWYRCSSIANPSSTTPLRFQVVRSDGAHSFAGDGTSGLYIWGCQIEQASFLTSYIKTTGSTATRSADVASIPVADFGYNQSEGTLFIEAQGNGDSTNFRRFMNLQDGSTNARWEIMGDTASDVRMRHHNGSAVDVNKDVLSDVLDGSTMFKMAYAIKDNDAAASGDGGTVVTDTSVDFCVPTVMYIGSGSVGASDFLCGHIKSIKYYPRRLTNAQLQEITS